MGVCWEWTSFYMIGTSAMKELTKKFFITADKLNTFSLLNKYTISPKPLIVLFCFVNLSNFSILFSSNILFFI